MEKEPCYFDGDCEFRYRCGCRGNKALLCQITYEVGGIFFVDKQTHPDCNAKTFFGDAHLCLCPAKINLA